MKIEPGKNYVVDIEGKECVVTIIGQKTNTETWPAKYIDNGVMFRVAIDAILREADSDAGGHPTISD